MIRYTVTRKIMRRISTAFVDGRVQPPDKDTWYYQVRERCEKEITIICFAKVISPLIDLTISIDVEHAEGLLEVSNFIFRQISVCHCCRDLPTITRYSKYRVIMGLLLVWQTMMGFFDACFGTPYILN